MRSFCRRAQKCGRHGMACRVLERYTHTTWIKTEEILYLAQIGRTHGLYAHEAVGEVRSSRARLCRATEEQIITLSIAAGSLESTSLKVHPDGTGALKKTARKPSDARAADSPPRFIWWPAMNAPRSASRSVQGNVPTARKAESCSSNGVRASRRS